MRTLTKNTYSYDAHCDIRSVGSDRPRKTGASGPTITSVLDCRGGHADPLDGFVVQDGAIPQGLAVFIQATLQFLPFGRRECQTTFVQRLRALLGRWISVFLGPFARSGAMQRTQAFVAMLHDGKSLSPGLRRLSRSEADAM